MPKKLLALLVSPLVMQACVPGRAPETQPAGQGGSRAGVETTEGVVPESPAEGEGASRTTDVTAKQGAEENPAEASSRMAPRYRDENYVEDELIIIGASDKEVSSLVGEFQGVVVESVAKVGAHRVRFAVESEEELEAIAAALRKRHVTVTPVYRVGPLAPGQQPP